MADLPALSELPSARLLVMTDRLRTAFSRERPGLFVGRALHRTGKAGLLAPAMRAWALTLSEVACARLPGGELVPDGDGVSFLPGVPVEGVQDHERTCGCGDWRNHENEPWRLLTADTMWAARDRDGARLFELFDRAVYDPAGSPADATNYVASLASSSCVAAAEAGLSRELDAVLHTLAYHSHVARQWAVAGPVYRLCAATLAAADIGPSMADAIIGPEVQALGRLRALDRVRAMSVVGMALAELLADDPAEEVDDIDIVAHVAGLPPRDGHQRRASELAVRFAIAYRNGAGDDEQKQRLVDLSNDVGPEGVALAVYGAANMLAVRMRELYGG